MKPNFALNITSDSIGLLHRTARGWLEIGATGLDAPDLPDALSYLRRSALGLAPHGMTAKVIIPNDQILYLTLEAPGPDDQRRDEQIRRALEGRTPYAVDDLVFDWSGDGPDVQVAVVARETLAEAEGFATEYRLNPVSFVAQPDPAQFAGEPWFGPSALAATLLPPGDIVERDHEPVQVISRDAPHRTDRPAPDMSVPEMVAPDPVMPDPVAAAIAAPELPEAVLPEIAPVVEPEPAPPVADHAAPYDTAIAAPEAEPMPEATAARADDTQAALAFDTPPEGILPDPAFAPAVAPEPPAPVLPPPVLQAPVVIPPVPPAPAVAEPPVEAAPPAFNSRRRTEPEAPPPLTPPPAPPRRSRVQPPMEAAPEMPPLAPPAPPPSQAELPLAELPLANLPPEPPAPPVAPKVAVTSVTAHRKAPPAPLSPPPLASAAATPQTYDPILADDPALDSELPPPIAPAFQAARAAARNGAATLGAAPASRASKPASAAKPAKPMVTAPTIPGLGGKRAKSVPTPTKAAQTLVAPPPPGAETSMPFRAKTLSQRGKPRYLGLILTIGLLLLLAALAAWSSFYIARGNAPEAAEVAGVAATPETSAEPVPDVIDEAAADGVTLPEDEALADGQMPAPVEDTAMALPTPEAGSETGAAPVLLPGAQDEIILSTMDTPPPAVDALALTAPQTTADALPQPPAPPPPFGTQYEFDAQGLIKPTAEGIVTPDGVRLVAGPPPVVPPQRPASIAALAAAPAATPTTDAAASAPAEGAAPAPYADPALAGFRPRARPEGLAPAAPDAAAAPADDAALAIPEASRMVSLKPRARPAAITAQAEQRRLDEEARLVAEAASLSAAAAAEALAAAPQGEASVQNAVQAGPISPLAIAVSRRPPQRPKDFSRAVEAAVAAAVRPPKAEPAPEPEPEPEPAARPTKRSAPEADDEPEVAAAAKAPKIPTKASVAKNATFVNAIDLGKTNLIGVYGTASKRYALIRTSSGQYKKVRVGDRVDGGTVAAITDSELRYKKGNRMVALQMPKG